MDTYNETLLFNTDEPVFETTVENLIEGFPKCCEDQYKMIWNYIDMIVFDKDDGKALDIICIRRDSDMYDIAYDFSWEMEDGILMVDEIPDSEHTEIILPQLLMYLNNRMNHHDNKDLVSIKFYTRYVADM